MCDMDIFHLRFGIAGIALAPARTGMKRDTHTGCAHADCTSFTLEDLGAGKNSLIWFWGVDEIRRLVWLRDLVRKDELKVVTAMPEQVWAAKCRYCGRTAARKGAEVMREFMLWLRYVDCSILWE